MTRKDWLSIGYISLLVVMWGTVGSLVDFLFLQYEIYTTGSLGQYSTFTIAAAITSVVGFVYFPKIIKD